MTLSSAARRELLDTIETQRFGCEMAGSPLYASMLDVIAADVEADGPFAHLLEPVAERPFGDAVVLRLLAALHRLVLDGEAPDLAEHCPSSVGPDPGRPAVDLRTALLSTAERQADAIAAGVAEGVQTNEVGRSASLLGGYLEAARLGLPLRVLELGASAGLNLLFDRYRYVDRDGAFGPADSPLSFVHPWYFGAPDLDVPLVVAERMGCDPRPIDVTTHQGRQRLRSYVWPDQLERLARLDAALEVAVAEPPRVDRAGAAVWLPGQLRDPVPGRCTVVVHSIVLQYLSLPDRQQVLSEIDRAGERATPDAPLAWLRCEPGGDQAEVRITTWPDGVTHLLATSAYHGPPVVWRAPRGGAVRPVR